MRIAIASHITLDFIDNIDNLLGGPACYCGLVCRQLGFETILATKVGNDLPSDKRDFLKKNGLNIKQFEKSPTTRFSLKEHGFTRDVRILSKCVPLKIDDVVDIDADGWIISPASDEVPIEVLNAITKKKKFVTLDPQGYIRKIEPSGLISLHKRVNLDLSGISVIKVDQNELSDLGTVNVEFLIYTETRVIHMNQYQLNIDYIPARDTTGLGDILSAAFTCTIIKEKDPKWAICCAAGAVTAALKTGSVGLNKIPSKSKIEEDAFRFLNIL